MSCSTPMSLNIYRSIPVLCHSWKMKIWWNTFRNLVTTLQWLFFASRRLMATSEKEPETLSARHDAVINRLKGKVTGTRAENLIGNRNAERGSKLIEIGWFDYDHEKAVYKQVRTQMGRGTIVLKPPKDTLVYSSDWPIKSEVLSKWENQKE